MSGQVEGREVSVRRATIGSWWAPVALLIAACGTQGSTASKGSPPDAGEGVDAGAALDAGVCPANPPTGDFPLDVAAVLQAKCQTCHQSPPINRAPFPLLTYEELVRPYGTTGKPIWQRVDEVIQPNGVPHMPYGTSPPLADAEMQTLAAWFARCAPPVPEGTGGDVGE